MGQKYKAKNGPAILELEEVVIGSKLAVAVKVSIETAPASGVFTDVDFATKEYACHVKDNPKSEADPVVSFICTPRGSGGWIDLYLDGINTAKLLERIYYASLKIWPIGVPADGDTFLVITIPAKFEATR